MYSNIIKKSLSYKVTKLQYNQATSLLIKTPLFKHIDSGRYSLTQLWLLPVELNLIPTDIHMVSVGYHFD